MIFSGLAQLYRVMVPLAGLMLVSGCTAGIEEGGQQRPPMRPDKQQMCTMEYAPVCGERNGNIRTFGNGCQAGAAGYRVMHKGECGALRPHQPQWHHRPDRPSLGGEGHNRPQTACTREYAPVCATSHGRSRTFPNACVARNAGFYKMQNGACR